MNMPKERRTYVRVLAARVSFAGMRSGPSSAVWDRVLSSLSPPPPSRLPRPRSARASAASTRCTRLPSTRRARRRHTRRGGGATTGSSRCVSRSAAARTPRRPPRLAARRAARPTAAARPRPLPPQGYGGQSKPVFKKKAKTTKKVTLRMECKECKYKMQQPLKRCKHFEVRRRLPRAALSGLAAPRRARRRAEARRRSEWPPRRRRRARAPAPSARGACSAARGRRRPLPLAAAAAAAPLAQIGANKQGKSKK